MNNGLGFQLANVPTITGLASVQADNVTTDTIEVTTLTLNGVDINTTLNDKVSKTLNNTVTGINTFSNPANVFYGDGANLTGISSSTVLLSNTATGTTNYLVMSTTSSGVSSLLTDNSGATYNSTNNTAAINITGNCSGTAGSVLVTATDLATIYYPLMSPGAAGAKFVFFDNATTPLSYQPSTSTLTASIFSGTATNATNAANVNLTVDNTATTYYPVFAASGGGNKPLLYDTTTTPLSYDPSTSTLTASIFNGSITNATNATNVNLTVDDTATVYYPTFAASGAGNKPLLYDTTTTPLSYQPSTSTLTASNYSIPTTIASSISASGANINITNNNVGGSIIYTVATTGLPLNILQLSEANSYWRTPFQVSTGTAPTSTPTMIIEESVSTQGFKILTNSTGGAFNALTQVNDAVLLGYASAASTKNITITSHSATTTGVRITPTTALIGAGGTTSTPSSYASFSSTGVSVAGATNFISPNITLNGASNFNVGHGAGGAGAVSNTIIGYLTPRTVTFTTGSNTFIGSSAGQNMGIASDSNTYVGTQAGVGQTTGKYNTFLGAYAGNQVSGTGWRNTAVGNMALDSMITIAENNTAVGESAGNQVSTGYNNTLIGWGAGGNITTGANNICIGALSAASSGTAQNEIIIGSASDTMFIKGALNLRIGTLITASISFVGSVLAQHYPVAMAAASQTITLPNPTTAAYLGARVTFKRRTNTTAFNFAAAGTTPFLGTTSITPVASPTTIGAAIFQVDMICDGVNWCFTSTT